MSPYRWILPATCLAFLLAAAVKARQAEGPGRGQILLQAGTLALNVDPGSGVFSAIRDETSGVDLAPPAGMADCFRLVLLRPDKSQLTILGRDQKLTRSEVAPRKLSLYWDGPLVDGAGGRHDIAVRIDVTVSGNAFEFRLHLQNRTSFKVQEAWYPLLGGLDKLASDATLWAPTSTPWQKSLAAGIGTATLGYPGQICMSFACVQSKRAGKAIYLSSQDEVARFKNYQFMQVTNSAGAKSVFACIRHSPFTPPGGSFDGSPVAMRLVDGDWRACGKVYRAWFRKAFGITQPSQCWLRKESFFVMTMFMLPEGTINFTYKDIPRWAKAAKDCGINAVQISGWHMGGHDNGYPDYTPDPRLGTWKELEDGIRACHRMGMKVYFFVNYGQAMVDSDWYKRELYKYREMTADGGYTNLAGWGMGTLWARMDHPKLMAWMDLSFPEFRKIIVEKFTKLAQIGADGVHVDKMFPTAIEYNPAISMSPDTAAWEGAIQLTKEVMASCRRYSPDWAMSFECNCDRLLQFTDATWWVGNQLITRQVFPEHVETLGLYYAWDFLGVNNAVRDGHVVMVAPLNFCRSMNWQPFRELGLYIKEVKRIRDALQDTVFLGEVLGQAGVDLKAGSGAAVEYNVFRNRATGRRVCVLTNASTAAAKVTLVGFGNAKGGTARVQVPFAKARTVKLPASLEVPAERIAFVEETGGGK
ncbi:MAG: DUF6259 domain-containing protein [Fimbriimonadales bacterium]